MNPMAPELSLEEKAVSVVGSKSNDDANIAGITPEGLTDQSY